MSEIGLSTKEAEALFKVYGPNDVSEKKTGLIKKIILPLFSPISLMLIGASVLSLFNGRVFDFYFILFLYFINYFVQKWQEFKADKAIDKLRDKLVFDVLALRDSKWIPISARNLVPGDRIKLGLGSIIPADGKVVLGKNLTVNEAVLTGESLPKEKKQEDKIFSGSFISTGSVEAKIIATGRHTYFGRTIFSIDKSRERSILEKDILSISRFLTIISLVAVLILTLFFIFKGERISEILTLDLSLIIAGIPVALPTVMAVILSIGAGGLSKKMVIVRRLSALQDLANVNLLLTDKTGTLTKNEIQVSKIISYTEEFNEQDLINLANLTVLEDEPDAIDMAIVKKSQDLGNNLKADILDLIPYDSNRKRSTAFAEINGKKILISLGAPQIIKNLDGLSSKEVFEKFNDDILIGASEGFRSLALAIKEHDEKEENMRIIGLFELADPLDDDAKDTLKFIKQNGIEVKMVTGDNFVIAERIAREIGLNGKVLSRHEVDNILIGKRKGTQDFDELDQVSGFAEVLPDDKYNLVKTFKNKYVVASTGDGINDLPALRVANVGIAVSGAVSALKSMADIVLLERGLSVIKDAIIEARKIFARLYTYSVYRISESFRLIITILVLGLLYGFYPLEPLQLIVLALLNDIPIISLAVDRVKIFKKPAFVKTKDRLILSLLFGFVGVLNSLILFFIMTKILDLPWNTIQTIFFLKLTISGHALIFVAHTSKRWYKFLPSKEVIIATVSTQIFATFLAISGFLMPAKISFSTALFVWLWAFLWMQISELMKDLKIKLTDKS